MKTLLYAIAAAFALMVIPSLAADVLIVADEFPAMEYLASRLRAEEGIASRIVAQTNMPADLSAFSAVIVYIHRDLKADAEQAFIQYTEAGGRLVALHHSISSGKRKNAHWFKFLGVDLPPGDVEKGGYQWTEGVTLDFVNLAPDHFMNRNKVEWPSKIPFVRTGTQGPTTSLPGFTLHDSEVYLNHQLVEPRTVLMGLRYTDAKTGKVWMQEHAGWARAADKGWIVYLMPGHSPKDFENPVYSRMVINAVIWKP